VLDVEVLIEARLHLVEQGAEVSVLEAGVVDDYVGGEPGAARRAARSAAPV
jgi:hypothetical protein